MPIGKIPVPLTHIDEEPRVSICVNVEWTPAILAMVTPAKYPEFWGGTLSENRRARREIQNLFIAIANAEECGQVASQCCVEPRVIKRVDPVTGMMQQSTDNGFTWSGASGGLDTVIVEPAPPVTSGVSGTKCDAATNVYEQILGWIDHVSNDFDTATNLVDFGLAVIGAIIGAVLVVVTGGGLAPLEALLLAALGAAFSAAWGAGKIAFDNYWTTEVKDKILCAAFCNIANDGTYSDAQFSAFWNDVNGDLPPSPAKMLFMGFLSSIGRQGLNAMAASGLSADADCADCVCDECAANNWSVPAGHPELGVVLDYGDDFVEVQAGLNTDGRYYLVIMTPAIDDCCQIESSEVTAGTFTNYVSGRDFCGEDRTIGTPNHVGDPATFGCANYFQFSSTTAWTQKFFFAACPP